MDWNGKAPWRCCALVGWAGFILAIGIGLVTSLIIWQVYLNTPVQTDNTKSAWTSEYHDEAYQRQLVEQVNSNPRATWKARYNPSASEYYPIDVSQPTTPASQSAATTTTTTQQPDATSPHFDYDYGEAYQIQRGIMTDSHKDLPMDYIRMAVNDRTQIPQNFDSRTKWPSCWTLHNIFDQGNCGACWAVSSATVMSDRTCIASNYTNQPLISPEDLIACCHICPTVEIDNGLVAHGTCRRDAGAREGLARRTIAAGVVLCSCDGGTSMNAFLQWTTVGVVSGGVYGSSAGCMPYTIASECGHPCPLKTYRVQPKCNKKCHPSYNKAYDEDKNFGSWFLFDRLPSESTRAEMAQLYNASTDVSIQTREFIQREIMRNGPIVVGISINEDMQHYASGVYKHLAGKWLAPHSIKLIGWGVENGEKYWLMADSFGRFMGENGFIKMSMSIPFEDFAFGMALTPEENAAKLKSVNGKRKR